MEGFGTGPGDLTGRRRLLLGNVPGCGRDCCEPLGRAVRTNSRVRKGYRGQMLLSMNAASWVRETAPTFCASMEPFLNSMRVGMPRTWYLGGVAWFSSMLSLATFRRPAYSEAIW